MTYGKEDEFINITRSSRLENTFETSALLCNKNGLMNECKVKQLELIYLLSFPPPNFSDGTL